MTDIGDSLFHEGRHMWVLRRDGRERLSGRTVGGIFQPSI